MTMARYLLGGAGAAWGALLPSLSLLLAFPPLVCATIWCPPADDGGTIAFGVDRPGKRTLIVSVGWSPYLDNSDMGKDLSAEDRCRAEGTTPPPALRIVDYAFPGSFQPASFPKRALFACILARGDGAILRVRLAQPIHGGAADRALVDTIRKRWRFEGTGDRGEGWERVRLNQGPQLDIPELIDL